MGNQAGSNPLLNMVQKWIDEHKIGAASKVQVGPIDRFGRKADRCLSQMPAKNQRIFTWNLWLAPAPERAFTPNLHPFNWRGWWDYGTGALGDVGCHLIDIPFRTLNLKYPTDAECSVGSVSHKCGLRIITRKVVRPPHSLRFILMLPRRQNPKLR